MIHEQFERVEGRIVENTGDGFLVTFRSGGQGVKCGVEIQRAIAAEHADGQKTLYSSIVDETEVVNLEEALAALPEDDSAGDREKARDLLHAALATATELRMQAWEERIGQLMARAAD